MQPLLNSITWELKTSEDNKEQLGFANEASGYTCRYVITHEGGYTPILPSFITSSANLFLILSIDSLISSLVAVAFLAGAFAAGFSNMEQLFIFFNGGHE